MLLLLSADEIKKCWYFEIVYKICSILVWMPFPLIDCLTDKSIKVSPNSACSSWEPEEHYHQSFKTVSINLQTWVPSKTTSTDLGKNFTNNQERLFNTSLFAVIQDCVNRKTTSNSKTFPRLFNISTYHTCFFNTISSTNYHPPSATSSFVTSPNKRNVTDI